jgi:DNA-binding IclR family transcriptional regulator
MTGDHASPLSGRQPKAVQTGLQVLEEVARRGTGVTAKEVAHSLHLPPATAYRVLNILVAEGYLVRTPDLHGFALGRKLSGLITAAAPPTICHAARQVLAELRGRVRFGVHLVLYTASAAKVVDPDPDHPYVAAQLLTRYLHASAVGKLLLSELPNWRETWPESWLRSATERTITTPTALDAELARIRTDGAAQEVGELRAEDAAIALPIHAVTGPLVGAIAVSAPIERADALPPILEQLRPFAERLSPLIA